MKRIIAAAFLIIAIPAFSQSPEVKQSSTDVPAASAPTKVHSSPAEDQLLELSKDFAANKAALNAQFTVAKANLDAKNKPLLDAINAKAKPLLDKIKQMTADLQKQIDDNNKQAGADYQNKSGDLQGRVNTVSVQIQILAPLVKKEQGLPEGSSFDPDKGAWIIPQVNPEPVKAEAPAAKK